MDFFIIGIILAVIFIVLINYVFFYDRKKFRYRKKLTARQKIPAAVPPAKSGEVVPVPEKGWDRDTTPIDYEPENVLPATMPSSRPDDIVPSALPSQEQEDYIPAAEPSFKPDDYVFAGFYRRVAAFIIDITIIYLLVYFILVNLKLTSFFEIAIFPVIILYFAYYDAGLSKLKASPGKRLLSIVVVNSQFQQVSFLESFERALLKTMIFWLFTSMFAWIAFIILFVLVFLRWKSPTFSRYQIALWDSNMTLWDMIVKTRVIFDPDKEWVTPADKSPKPVQPDSKKPEIKTSQEPVQPNPIRSKITRLFSDKRIIASTIVIVLVLAVFGLGSAYYKPGGSVSTGGSSIPAVSVSTPHQPTTVVPVRTSTRVPTPVPTLEKNASVTLPFTETITLNTNTVARSFQSDITPIFISLKTDPKMITDKKIIFRSPSDTVGTEQDVTRPDENAYFTIVVRDLTNGGVVAEDGYGKQYSSETLKVIRILKEGRYEAEISGSRVTVNLAISLSSTQTPSGQLTKISTPATTQSDTSWISATIDKSEFVVGGLATVSGTVSGTTGPVVYSVYTFEDVRDNNYNNPAVAKSFYPSAGGSYKTTIYLDPKILPVGSYVIVLKIPSGQTTKLQFLVSAKGVDCTTICDQVYLSGQNKEGLQYNDKGEAICYC